MNSKTKYFSGGIGALFLASVLLASGALTPTNPSQFGTTQFGTFTSSYVDLSTSIYFPPIGDQLSEGSCVSWAVVYYAMGFQVAKQYNWRDTYLGNTTHLLSPNFVFGKVTTLTKTGQDMGSGTSATTQFVQNWGVCTMASHPYNIRDIGNWGSLNAMNEAGNYKITGSVQLSYSDPLLIQKIKTQLSLGVPVCIAMDGNAFATAFKDGNKMISAIEYSIYTQVNHCQCIVGFDDSKSDDGSVGAFKIANSWGSGFGENGFYWFSYDNLKQLSGKGAATYLKVPSKPVKPTLRIDFKTDGNLSMAKNFMSVKLVDSLGKVVKSKTVTYSMTSGNAWRMLPNEVHFDISEFNTLYKTGKYKVVITLSNITLSNTLELNHITSYKVQVL